MLKEKATEQTPMSLRFYTRVFLVLKKNGKQRPVFNMKPLNTFIYVPEFTNGCCQNCGKGFDKWEFCGIPGSLGCFPPSECPSSFPLISPVQILKGTVSTQSHAFWTHLSALHVYSYHSGYNSILWPFGYQNDSPSQWFYHHGWILPSGHNAQRPCTDITETKVTWCGSIQGLHLYGAWVEHQSGVKLPHRWKSLNCRDGHAPFYANCTHDFGVCRNFSALQILLYLQYHNNDFDNVLCSKFCLILINALRIIPAYASWLQIHRKSLPGGLTHNRYPNLCLLRCPQ